jgi:sulfide dehydrogenase cytochrome subunit
MIAPNSVPRALPAIASTGADTGIPPIIGLGEERLIRAMLAYRSSERPSHIMHAIALSLSDQEIARVARFLAAQDKKATPP